jgi:hypothetical protein
MAACLVAGCGSSSAKTVAPTANPTASPSSPEATLSPTVPTPTPAVTAQADVPKKGLASATCVNGWTEPAAPTDDFFKQAVAAFEQNQGGTGYVVKSVRYFAGPLANGGVGAVYYLNVADPRFTARVLLVSGAGPGQAAAAPSNTAGWKAGDWKGFQGQAAPATFPPLPGKWSGPEYDPVTGGLLSPGIAGCLSGT